MSRNESCRPHYHRVRSGQFSVLQVLMSGGSDIGWEPEQASEPTDHMPGTPGKIEALSRRILLGQTLFNEEDRDDYDERKSSRF
jgi:hypothetical protein